MIETKVLIIGAGIGGLAAGAELKSKGETNFVIIDKSPSVPRNLHNGSHYLHSIDFGTPFPFKFKKIPLTEEIWNTRTNTFTKSATFDEVIEYSKKIMENKRHITYITEIGKVREVYCPDDNNMDSLIDAYVDYIGKEHFVFGENVESIYYDAKEVHTNTAVYCYENLISTMPLDALYKVSEEVCPYELKNKVLYITNFKNCNIVNNWMIILYMTDLKLPVFRISTMNGILSMESMRELTHDDDVIIKYLIGDTFDYELNSKTSFRWETGRIFGLTSEEREQITLRFAQKRVYLVGRFANWNGKLRMDTTILQAKEIVNKII